MRKLSDLTNDELEKLIEEYFDSFIRFGENIKELNYQGNQFYESLLKLLTLFRQKILNKDKLDDVFKDMIKSLSLVYPKFESKILNYTKIIMFLIIEEKDYFIHTVPAIKSIKNVVEGHDLLFSSKHTVEYLNSILNQHVRETEKIEYYLIKELKISSKIHEFDIEELFSIRGKIKKDTGFVTQSRAIRDCIGHSKYLIDKNSLNIHFENYDYGYDFNQKYTFEEFVQFMHEKIRLYILFINISYIFYARNLIGVYARN